MSSPPDNDLIRQLNHADEFLENLAAIAPAQIQLNPPVIPGHARGVTIDAADMALRIGDSQEFSGTANRDGYLHLINLGTDGRVHILLHGDGPAARVRRGAHFRLPAPPFFPADIEFIIAPPPTRLANQLDTMLVLITDEPICFTVTQLHPHFLPPEGPTARSPLPPAGSFGSAPPPKTLADLLGSGEASYGFLRFQILPSAQPLQ